MIEKFEDKFVEYSIKTIRIFNSIECKLIFVLSLFNLIILFYVLYYIIHYFIFMNTQF